MVRVSYTSTACLLAACSASAQDWTAVRLHPAGAVFSHVYAVTATQQGGMYRPQIGDDQGGFWRGSAESWTLLTPPQAYGVVAGMDGTRQVGGVGGQAALWYGTPESRVNLGLPNSSSGASGVR